MAFATISHSAPDWADPSTAPASKTLVLAITGASGSIFAVQALRALERDPRVNRVHLIVSPSALRVLAEEAGISARNSVLEKLLGRPSEKTTLLAHEDIGAPVASGSYPLDAMIVLPCSMGTLAGIAHGMAGNLIERAADVCLKERRRLVLCVRETPLNLIQIRNMAAATEAGATIFPVIPTFYNHPQTVDDIARNYAHRVLQHIGLPQPDAYVWGADQPIEDLT
jgi:4-hydroxy-3-polyprenylbenzoate decarboxylase